MIKNFLCTGDLHRDFSRFKTLDPKYNTNETAIFILGDSSINYRLNETDYHMKKFLSDKYNFTIYCVRGNHEERPENINGMTPIVDESLMNYVLYEEEFPNIRYLIDGNLYTARINHKPYTILPIGGAYSVDKKYRLARAMPDATWTGWFPSEQLTEIEMYDIEMCYAEMRIDIIMSHTCPFSWMPTDLFISGIDNSTVDNTMERWMNVLKNKINWNYWFFWAFSS